MDSKLKTFVLVLAVLVGLTGISNRAEARAEVTLDVFYDALSPYGEWIEHDYYGYIWRPEPVGPYWKPYSDGNWQYSEEGWIWVSNEPWGWATYHYGRWVPDDYYGWVWIPGVTWAPSYVEWYDSPGYIGWAPRPPDKSFFLEIGIGGAGFGYSEPGFGFNFSYYKPYKPYKPYKHYRKKHYKKHYYDHHHYYPPPEHCVYVPYKHFGRKNAKFVSVEHHNTVVYRNTTNITNVTYVNNKKVYKGPDRHYIEKRAGRKIKRVDVVERDKIVYRGGRDLNRVKGNKYEVYRPKVVKNGYEKPKNISRTYDRKKNHRPGYKGNSIKHGLKASESHSVVKGKGYGYKGDKDEGYGKDRYQNRPQNKAIKGFKAENKGSKLTPVNKHKKHVNRQDSHRSYKNKKPPVYERRDGYKNGVKREGRSARYDQKKSKNNLRGSSSINSVSMRKDKFNGPKKESRNFNSRKPFKAENKSVSPKKTQRGQAAFKSNKGLKREKSFNQQRPKKSFKPQNGYKANKSVKKVNKSYNGGSNSYQKANKKKVSKNKSHKSVSKSNLQRNTDRSRNNYRNLSQRSTNRQVMR